MLVRPLFGWKPQRWDDFPADSVILKVEPQRRQRDYAVGFIFAHNSKVVEAGGAEIYVMIPARQNPRRGMWAGREVPEFTCG